MPPSGGKTATWYVIEIGDARREERNPLHDFGPWVRGKGGRTVQLRDWKDKEWTRVIRIADRLHSLVVLLARDDHRECR